MKYRAPYSVFILALVAAAWACSDRTGVSSSSSSSGENGGGDGGTSGEDGGDPKVSSCRGRSFGGPSDWKLPFAAASTNWQTGSSRYALFDIHGDGKPDLIITGDESDKDIGKTKWLVYKNTGSSFESNPETWTLPMPAPGTNWQTGSDRYALVDIHGDGKPDLVITGKDGDTSIGKTKWMVFKNTGSNFESNAETWALPSPAPGTNWQTGSDRYALVDIHGDGKPDLVITGKDGDANVGKTTWMVYKNSGSAFAGSAETWNLPMPAPGTNWQTGSDRYALLDIHGDGKPDLIITGKDGDTDIGKTKWLVFKNSGSNFAGNAETWNLPSPAPGTMWTMGSDRYALVDIHGDGKPDLIITGKDGDTELGKTKWSVFSNNGSSFESSAESWALDKPMASVAWYTGTDRYALIDIHGDKRPDLVFTGIEGDMNVGKTKWIVQSNDCR